MLSQKKKELSVDNNKPRIIVTSDGEIDDECSLVRCYFPHTKSVLMDSITFDKFFENDFGTLTNVILRLNLTADEQKLYDILKTKNWRLKQEKITFDYVNQYFDNEISPAS